MVAGSKTALEPSAPPLHEVDFCNTPPPPYAPPYEEVDSNRPPPYSPPEQKEVSSSVENGNKSNKETGVSKQEKRLRKRKRNRVLFCLGWILCCPIFTACWALREPHVDEEDLKDDDCYPCFS